MMSPFYRTIEAAIADIEAHGFDSQARIDGWLVRIEAAARESATPEAILQIELNKYMQSIYSKMITKKGILTKHKGVGQFTVDRLSPLLQNELERRKMASAQLIRMNRQSAIADTLQRFSGWSTSIPKGGSRAVEKKEVKTSIRKALTALPYEERRVLIDQGQKFTSSLNNIIATNGGAIAMEWNSHFRQPGYNYRKDHKERDGRIYLLRGNWAQEKGLVKKGPAGYYDEVTAVGEEVFCQCSGTYIYNLRDLPADMLTAKGAEALKAAAAA